jgi:predicted nucleic acid-binding protein
LRVLLDTNVAVRLLKRRDDQHERIHIALRTFATDDQLVLAPQVIYESWVILTRPTSGNSFGLDVSEAAADIRDMLLAYDLLPDPPELPLQWLALCERYDVIGKQAHDARLASFAIVHGLDAILTLNPGDFKRFPGIRLIEP